MTLQEIKSTTIWLQGIGACQGKPARELIVGDVMGWNYGGTSVVASIIKETKATVTISAQWEDPSGNVKFSPRTMNKSKIVAIVKNGKFTVVNVTKSMIN